MVIIIIAMIFLGHHFLTRKQGRLIVLEGQGVCTVGAGTIQYILNGKEGAVDVKGNGVYHLPLPLRNIVIKVLLSQPAQCPPDKDCMDAPVIYHPKCKSIKLGPQLKTYLTFIHPNKLTKQCVCMQTLGPPTYR